MSNQASARGRPADNDACAADASREDLHEAPAVVGTADASLLIERISGDAEGLFGVPVKEMLGRSLLSLVDQNAVPRCLSALGEAAASQNGVTLRVGIRVASATPRPPCEVLFLPLHPSPSVCFVFLPKSSGGLRGPKQTELSAILLRLSRGGEVMKQSETGSRGVERSDVPGLESLTRRELQIVTRLMSGHRPPSIARDLYLSQSTVRNHLGSAFVKLGVHSQQELVNLLRSTGRFD